MQIFYDANTEMLFLLLLSFPLIMAYSKERFRIPLYLLPLYDSVGEQVDVSKRLTSVADGSFAERQSLIIEGQKLLTKDSSSLLIGVPVLHLMDLGTTNSMHNGFLELLVSTGLIGSFAFSGFLAFRPEVFYAENHAAFHRLSIGNGVFRTAVNSMIFLLFVSFLVCRPDFGQWHILPSIPKKRTAPFLGLEISTIGNGSPR